MLIAGLIRYVATISPASYGQVGRATLLIAGLIRHVATISPASYAV
jgi:hypothetical protein